MDCLEEKLEELDNKDCKEAVVKYVEDVEQNPELDKIFSDSCKEFWNQYCKVGSLLVVKITVETEISSFYHALKLMVG